MCFKHLMRKFKTTSTTITITTLTPNQTTTPTSPFIKGGLRGIFFKAQGGLRKMYQLFGADMESLINELNGELVA